MSRLVRFETMSNHIDKIHFSAIVVTQAAMLSMYDSSKEEVEKTKTPLDKSK